MKLTQLSTSEFKLDLISNLNLGAQKNCMVLTANSFEIVVFELMYSCDTMILMPYSNKQISVPQDKPLNSLLRNIDLVSIYEKANVFETQELALDPIYVAECSVDPLKARVLQAEVIPKDRYNLLCLLTTYGLCEIYQKEAVTGQWQLLKTNLPNILSNDIYPPKESSSSITTFTDLRSFINKYIITSFSIALTSGNTIIYLGTAAGYVIALKFIESLAKFELYCTVETSLSRIAYITNYQNLMLLGCDQGKVCLVKINYENKTLEQIGFLWNKADRMVCRHATINHCEHLNSYLVIFCKSAHLLAFRVDDDGNIVSKSRLYVGGIKISGLESMSKNEFIITTITGCIRYVRVVCPSKNELIIEGQEIEHDFDSSNYQILGVAASASKNLWSFLLYRNKEYVHQSKFAYNSVFLNVCKLSIQDSFTKLMNLNVKYMNMAQDLVMAINLEIFNNIELDKYINYLPLEELGFPKRFNDIFLQKLQIKLIIARKFAKYQLLKYRKVKSHTENDIEFLEASIQLLYILGRLQYLRKIHTSDHKFTTFQESSIVCMQTQFTLLINKLMAIGNSEEEESNKLQKTIENCVLLITDEFEIIKFNEDSFEPKKEFCSMCNEAINEFEKCINDHKVTRCSLSYTQISLFRTTHCPHCFALARNDDDAKLSELFPTDEFIKCTFCRFLFNQDGF
ncbi:hypothetical protein DOY81_001761 [Sarcophaga bullata]|nr:hypothetical protein DOY81_001761 [Sarcophaga bullata]